MHMAVFRTGRQRRHVTDWQRSSPADGFLSTGSCTFPLSLVTCRAAWVSRSVGNGF